MIRMGCLAASALALSLVAFEARADSRVVDGVLGAGAGALVGGPVGLVAGGVIGYSAGPSISCAMRSNCRRHRHHRHHRH
ncbi:hypothetical protein GJ654_13300 [Rhodoblastus acidophilus]|uniref:Glycine zipper domain-containing protein n=1 Tax=Rhodoblastus acidophilus TaxID=1074 RepID=A0A6N8DS06_RHOAC|nr:hypothetical protein [Rhodoblastus acidophilus]MCW2275481.1 hypothetical protein [Rhodoblastus acidophilus]MTV31963.1 hypothetical protein [Rhodoblastus acidophilus]